MQKIVKLSLNVTVEKYYKEDNELDEKISVDKVRNAVANALPECYALTDCFVDMSVKDIKEYKWMGDEKGWVEV